MSLLFAKQWLISLNTESRKHMSDEKVNIAKEYNQLVKEIPWDSLKEFPEKLKPLQKYAGMLNIKIDELSSLDIASPVKKVVTFLGVLVSRLKQSEESLIAMQKQLDELKERK